MSQPYDIVPHYRLRINRTNSKAKQKPSSNLQSCEENITIIPFYKFCSYLQKAHWKQNIGLRKHVLEAVGVDLKGEFENTCRSGRIEELEMVCQLNAWFLWDLSSPVCWQDESDRYCTCEVSEQEVANWNRSYSYQSRTKPSLWFSFEGLVLKMADCFGRGNSKIQYLNVPQIFMAATGKVHKREFESKGRT